MRFQHFVQRLVLSLVVLYPQQEVVQNRVILHVFVVGTVDFDFFDGGLDDFRIIANRFDEQKFVAHLLDHHLVNHPPPLARRVGGVEHLKGVHPANNRRIGINL